MLMWLWIFNDSTINVDGMYRCYAVRICWFVVYKAKFSVALRFVSLAHLQSIYRWYLVCARLMVIVTSNCSRCIHHSVSVCMGQSVSLAQTNDNETLPHDTMSLIIPISLFSPTHSLTVCVCVADSTCPEYECIHFPQHSYKLQSSKYFKYYWRYLARSSRPMYKHSASMHSNCW